MIVNDNIKPRRLTDEELAARARGVFDSSGLDPRLPGKQQIRLREILIKAPVLNGTGAFRYSGMSISAGSSGSLMQTQMSPLDSRSPMTSRGCFM